MEITFILILVVIVFLILALSIRIVPQSKAYVIERLGTYVKTCNVGINFLVPFIDKVSKIVSLKEHILDFPLQSVITKDNVTMQIDTAIYIQVADPRYFTYGAEEPQIALENLTATTLRNLVGELDLDSTLTSREIINTKMRSILSEASVNWGIRVTRVELQNILPPKEIQEAMEKQMKAERERRGSILRAEGEKQSKILKAQGTKESQILEAEGEKQSIILRSEAKKETTIKEAEGEAIAIKSIQKAKADAIVFLRNAEPNEQVLALKAMETFEKISNGESTKIIIPSNIQNIVGFSTLFFGEKEDKVDDKDKDIDNNIDKSNDISKRDDIKDIESADYNII